MAHTIYKNESGKRLKSVTTIINGNLGWKTGALIGWNLKLVDQGLNPRAELKKAGRIGTLAHTMIEEFTKGGVVKLDGYEPDEISKFWLHQANARMINLIVSKVIGSNEFDTKLAPLPIQKFGNLASAGSMFAFNLNNDLEKGQKGIICSFGAGYSVCSLLVERV